MITGLGLTSVGQFFGSRSQPESVTTWMSRQVSLGGQLIWDAMGRLRRKGDSLEKLHKLVLAGFEGGMLWYGDAGAPRLKTMSEHLWSVNDFLGASGFFGRAQAVTAYNKGTGRLAITYCSPFKAFSMISLAAGKFAELLKVANKVEVLPVAQLASIDVNYLGGICSRIGGTSLIRIAGLGTLSGVKNYCMLLSASYAILDNVINLVDLKKWDAHSLAKIGLGIANDIGKMVMILWFYWFTVTWTFVAVSSTVATIGISKILFESYSETGKPAFLR